MAAASLRCPRQYRHVLHTWPGNMTTLICLGVITRGHAAPLPHITNPWPFFRMLASRVLGALRCAMRRKPIFIAKEVSRPCFVSVLEHIYVQLQSIWLYRLHDTWLYAKFWTPLVDFFVFLVKIYTHHLQGTNLKLFFIIIHYLFNIL